MSKIKILLLFLVGVVMFAGFATGVSESQQATKQDKPNQLYKPVTQTKESGAVMTAQAALKEMIDKKEIALVGGIYDISTGEVKFFEK